MWSHQDTMVQLLGLNYRGRDIIPLSNHSIGKLTSHHIPAWGTLKASMGEVIGRIMTGLSPNIHHVTFNLNTHHVHHQAMVITSHYLMWEEGAVAYHTTTILTIIINLEVKVQQWEGFQETILGNITKVTNIISMTNHINQYRVLPHQITNINIRNRHFIPDLQSQMFTMEHLIIALYIRGILLLLLYNMPLSCHTPALVEVHLQ